MNKVLLFVATLLFALAGLHVAIGSLDLIAFGLAAFSGSFLV